jgi:hypothetical protein
VRALLPPAIVALVLLTGCGSSRAPGTYSVKHVRQIFAEHRERLNKEPMKSKVGKLSQQDELAWLQVPSGRIFTEAAGTLISVLVFKTVEDATYAAPTERARLRAGATSPKDMNVQSVANVVVESFAGSGRPPPDVRAALAELRHKP